jgi:predicted O-methyltransferase YrrM
MKNIYTYRYPAQLPIEFESLCQLVRTKKPKSIMEIGSRHGRSLIRLAEAGMPTLERVTTIDLPEGVWGEKGSLKSLLSTLADLERRGLSTKKLIGSSHTEHAKDFIKKNGPYDMIMIDGDHTYEGVTMDWELARESLAPEGAIAFHDIAANRKFRSFPDPSGMWHRQEISIGVPLLWAEIKAAHPHHLEFIKKGRSMGIGVVFPGLPETEQHKTP